MGNNSTCSSKLIDDSLQQQGVETTISPQSVFFLLPCANVRALCKVLTIQVIMEGNLTHFIAIVTKIASLDAVLAVSAQ